jgi:uncharacterized protein YprB with RNaseH-like and TPR domain
MCKSTGVTKRRRLFFDIETSPNVGLFWQAGYKQRIDSDNIIKERGIICICYKWEDEKEVYGLTWDRKQNDRKMIEEFIKVAELADELIGHNGDKFDLAWIRTRCLFHDIEMFPTYQTIDTLKVARSKFRFNSNRLNYIGQYLGIGQKIKTDFNLWKDVLLKNDAKALVKMVTYCKGDVKLLENIFKKLNQHIPNKTHYGVIFGTDRGNCPECGSDELDIVRRRVTATGLKKIQFRCKTCGKHNTKSDK